MSPCVNIFNLLSVLRIRYNVLCLPQWLHAYRLKQLLSWDVITIQVNSALHHSRVAKSSTSFSWGKGGKVTVAGWQVTLCDPTWYVISCSGVVISITNCYIRVYFLLLLASWYYRPAADDTTCCRSRHIVCYICTCINHLQNLQNPNHHHHHHHRHITNCMVALTK